MLKYIIKRLLAMIPVLLGVILVVFLIMSMTNGDAATIILGETASEEALEAVREEWGLNDSLPVQYVRYIFNLCRGDFGTSYRTGKAVADEIFTNRFPATLRLAVAALVFSLILALPLGIFAAIKQNTWFDTISMVISLIGISMPAFWLALLAILLFSVTLGWFPATGAEGFKSLILPALTLGFMHMAAIARTTRSSMLETVRQDYIRTARSKGVSKMDTIMNHALRNAMIPTLTVIGIQVGSLLGGAVLTETVFSWPGMGRYLVLSIQGRDTPAVLGCIVVFTVCFSLVNLFVDILYGFVDPRINARN